jgi:hypothetical protein
VHDQQGPERDLVEALPQELVNERKTSPCDERLWAALRGLAAATNPVSLVGDAGKASPAQAKPDTCGHSKSIALRRSGKCIEANAGQPHNTSIAADLCLIEFWS